MWKWCLAGWGGVRTIAAELLARGCPATPYARLKIRQEIDHLEELYKRMDPPDENATAEPDRTS